MRRAAALLLVAMALFVVTSRDTFGQLRAIGNITTGELSNWSLEMHQFRDGPEGCPALIDEIRGIIQDIIDAAQSDSDTNWQWVSDYGPGVAGWTYFRASDRTGAIRWDSSHRPLTQLSEAELERSQSAGEFLWGVAHEAKHWTTAVEVTNGRITNRHVGADWGVLKECFGIKD